MIFILPCNDECCLESGGRVVRELSPERWQRLEPILDRVFELAPDERASYLDEACAADPDLRRDAEALLAADRDSTSFLEAPAAAVLLAEHEIEAAARSRIGTIIGAYRIVRELGSGGMGTVYLAERADGQFDQRVALKLIRGAPSDEVIRRFLNERQILARLEHPNIARLLDGGLTPDGEPYFAMEYVDGEPITKWCLKQNPPLEVRLRLFCAAAEAVAFAHRNLIVHRDLKPSNVMVTAGGQVKLLDFGIAKLLEAQAADPALTRTGLYMLTPEYAAPEQVLGSAVTTATDVYTLGTLLYELLTGQRAHRFDQHTPAAFAHIICDRDPVLPSTAIGMDDAGRASTGTRGTWFAATRLDPAARRLRRRLHGDLDNIVMMALRKEPERRYPSVEALLADIERYEEGRPVQARRDSPGYRASRFVRRHRVAVAAAIIVGLSLVAGMLGTTYQARLAARESATAAQVKDFVIDLFTLADPDLSNADEITARQLLERGDERVNIDLAGQPELQAEMLTVLGSINRKLGRYDEAATRLQRALELERTLHGDQNAKVAAILNELGLTAFDQSRMDDAERLHGEALALRRELFGPRSPEVARSLNGLAEALNANGRFAEAEDLQRQALAIDSAALGPEDAEVANDLESLATILHDRGAYAEAVATGRQTLALRRRILGDDHLETATAMNNLAGYLRRIGRLGEADSLYRAVLAFDMLRLGENHPNTATVTNNLAGVLHEQGRTEEADSLYRKVLEFDRRHFGEQHRYTALVMSNLAIVLRDRQEYTEAEQLLREARVINQNVFGDDHPSIGITDAALASVLHERGDLRTAETLYRASVDLLNRSLGEHPRTAIAESGLGRLLNETGRSAEAEPLLRAAIRVLGASYPDNDVRLADARRSLGESLLARRRFAEAEELLISCFETLQDRPSETKRLRNTATALVNLYQAWNKPGHAEPYRAVAKLSQVDSLAR
jgi:serine/threonine-protein kinase